MGIPALLAGPLPVIDPGTGLVQNGAAGSIQLRITGAQPP